MSQAPGPGPKCGLCPIRGRDLACIAWHPLRHAPFCAGLAAGRITPERIAKLSEQVAGLPPEPPPPHVHIGGRWPGGPAYQAPPGDGQITVVIPTRDRPHLVGRAIRSVLAQTRKPARIIVVKNGAGHFQEYLDAFGGWVIDPLFLFLWRDDLAGFAGPINAGLERADTEYAAVLDDDDKWNPEFLAELAAALDADRSLGLAYTDATHPDEAGPDRGHPTAPAMPTFFAAMAILNWFGCSQGAFRVDLLRPGLLAPEADGSADWDAWLKIAAKAGVYHVPKPLVAHWWHGGNASLDTAARKQGQEWVRAGIRDGRYGHQDPPGRDADRELVRSLTDLQRAAVESCGHRREVDRCCGPATYCDLGRIETSATATADCARCVTADLPR
jgi:hypothetical protein